MNIKNNDGFPDVFINGNVKKLERFMPFALDVAIEYYRLGFKNRFLRIGEAASLCIRFYFLKNFNLNEFYLSTEKCFEPLPEGWRWEDPFPMHSADSIWAGNNFVVSRENIVEFEKFLKWFCENACRADDDPFCTQNLEYYFCTEMFNLQTTYVLTTKCRNINEFNYELLIEDLIDFFCSYISDELKLGISI